MFIQTEITPNPDTLKFLPGKPVINGDPQEFDKSHQIQNIPLVSDLLAMTDVNGVFLGNGFVSITKTSEASWAVMKPAILEALMTYFSHRDLISSPLLPQEALPLDESPIACEIRDILESRVRPAVAQDGGDIVFDHFDQDQGIVYLKLKGACAGCPSSTATLKNGIENMLRHYIPEVQAVQAI
jgi:Fe-S cluster biogenesis protein NfuA